MIIDYYDKWITLFLFEFMEFECRTIDDILIWYEVADEEILKKFRSN